MNAGERIEDPLAEHFVRSGRLTAESIARAREVQGPGDRLAALLLKLGMVSEREMSEAQSALTGVPIVGAEDFPALPLFEDRLSAKFLREARALPIRVAEEGALVAMAFPDDGYTRQALSLAMGVPVLPRVAASSEIEAAITRLYSGAGAGHDAVAGGLRAVDARIDDVDHLRDLASEAPVIRMVNTLLQRAMAARASDIHIEPFERRMQVRFRVDGVLAEAESAPLQSAAAVISRIKIMARMNIAERRLPQDGRIQLQLQGRDVDIRVSSVPTLFGESVVLRILDRQNLVLDFERLGFEDTALRNLNQALAEPHGILLVTGPTGSGKTTTLYTALHKLNSIERKVFTVEDPIEYQLEGINQLQVNPQIDLTFASALRAILRQDPDVIMIGEMRDTETARIAVQASLTGHLVLSTLHTNDAGGSVARLLDMGVEDYLLGSTLRGVIAQRLVRVLCRACRHPLPAADLAARLGAGVGTPADATLFAPRGCPECNHSGYRGRMSILEFLVVDDRMRQLIKQRADAHAMQQAAIAGGMRTMYQDGILKACRGLTSIEEVLRVSRGADDAAV
ncbi:MAG: type II secretion system ATPase GspE [Gammaproteobacteria bacterium]